MLCVSCVFGVYNGSQIVMTDTHMNKNKMMDAMRGMAVAAMVGAAVVAVPMSLGLNVATAAESTVQASGKQAKQDLKDMLSKLSAFSAQFKQELSDRDGSLVADGAGELYLKRPDQFIMYTHEPDPTVLYTKGKDIYFYDEGVNQVSIFTSANLSSNPMMLLSGTDDSVWDDYKISRYGDRFTLTPIKSQEIRSLTISFMPASKSKDGVQLLDSLTLRMDDGNTNFYLFSKQTAMAPDAKFNFKYPADAEVDDQR